MMRLILFITSLLFISCQSPSKEPLDFYKPSEMTQWMHVMYQHHDNIKWSINSNKDLPALPPNFTFIREANSTGNKERDSLFIVNQEGYLSSVKVIYEADTKHQRKEAYNYAVSRCISCHQNTCGGPIPKIKKLYLNQDE